MTKYEPMGAILVQTTTSSSWQPECCCPSSIPIVLWRATLNRELVTPDCELLERPCSCSFYNEGFHFVLCLIYFLTDCFPQTRQLALQRSWHSCLTFSHLARGNYCPDHDFLDISATSESRMACLLLFRGHIDLGIKSEGVGFWFIPGVKCVYKWLQVRRTCLPSTSRWIPRLPGRISFS